MSRLRNKLVQWTLLIKTCRCTQSESGSSFAGTGKENVAGRKKESFTDQQRQIYSIQSKLFPVNGFARNDMITAFIIMPNGEKSLSRNSINIH